MEVAVNKQENSYLIDIVVPKGTVDKEITRVATAIQPHAEVKGFRKGKVPLDVVKGQYSNAIKGEASTRILYESIAQALRDHGIKNVGNPVLLDDYRPTKQKPHVGMFGLDGTLKFKVTVEAPPEIDVQDYVGIEVETDHVEYDNWLSQELFKSQAAFGEKDQVYRASEIGDEVVIGFDGKLNGESFEGGTVEDYIFVLGQGTFLPDFEAAYVGREPGEEFNTVLEFPIDYMEPALAGQKVEFACVLREVYELKPHPLDDDLAMMLSYGSLDEMMESLKESWVDEFEKPLRMKLFNGVMTDLLERTPFDVPSNWVDQEMGVTVQRMGLDPSQVSENEHMVASVREIAERSVKVSYLLDKIYEKEESIHLTAEELENIANDEAARIGKTGMEYLDELRKVGRYDAFVSFQEQQKVVDFLVSNAIMKE